jgi:carboxyl-terminal processing protease
MEDKRRNSEEIMNKHEMISILAVLLFVAGGLKGQELSKPEMNFETLWKTFDRRYAIFLPKRVDWNALYRVYRPKVTPRTTDDELFEIMSGLLGHLNDNHVRLMTADRKKTFSAGLLQRIHAELFASADEAVRFMRERPVAEGRIQGGYQVRLNGRFAFGRVADGIGYFHFSGFGDADASAKVVDEIVAAFQDDRAVIIDVRRNGGGDDRVGKAIADRFADAKRLYMITQVRNGDAHDDFTETKRWYVEPDGPSQFTKPVILLTDRFSISAAENFALALRVLPHATIVGDFTSGCFADVAGDTLPNGWRFSVSYKLFVDQDGFCWEGIGVPPDLMVVNSKEDLAKGRDRVLDLAVDLVHSGALKPRPKTYRFPIEDRKRQRSDRRAGSPARPNHFFMSLSNAMADGEKSIDRTNASASRAPYSRSMPLSSHSTESGPL